VSRAKEVTTLGRGGSDTTAVALAVALGAERVEFCKPVPGVYDPYPEGRLCEELNYEEAHRIASRSPVLHPRSIELAQKNRLPLYVRSFEKGGREGTWIREDGKKQAPQYEKK